jgi:hypothetical protein|tara:strand:- start:1205 stop:1465 length:261 start_codon:yes stop_codon:yes gene_type:complete
MFTQESENLAKTMNEVSKDARLALLALDKLEAGFNAGLTDSLGMVDLADFRDESVNARNRILDVIFKLVEFSANPAGPKPEPVTKA